MIDPQDLIDPMPSAPVWIDEMSKDPNVEKLGLRNTKPGGVWRTLLEAFWRGGRDIRNLLRSVVNSIFNPTGDWADLKAAEHNVQRILARQTEGKVILTRSDATTDSIIPEGSIFRTKPDMQGKTYRYLSTARMLFPAGQTELPVPIRAESPGAAYNVPANTITQIVTHLPVDAVTNRDDWITAEGLDRESDDSLNLRRQLVWTELAQGGGNALTYESIARSVPGVLWVSVDDTHPRGQGTVDVYIGGVAGAPPAELIELAQAKLNEKKSIIADVLAKAPTMIPVNIEGTIFYDPDYGDPTTLLPQHTEVLQVMVRIDPDDKDIYPLVEKVDKFGLPVDRIEGNLRTIPYTVSVKLTSPAQDLLPLKNQRLEIGTINLTYQAAVKQS
ncbi:baseplate J/gp47 family protein [Brevibacillus centrosporus]|uniref:Baseplate J-like protein n=1 Tax=Brevibacillus centrosporus TaxID=54910 RepID=A0A1I3LY79_9BACL|nr:baseplate J/gp47 family protein [Brevibacillus centrosporus]SFI89741.1 Baseplate J-like protein [Brevibacillus centrosporus]